jgi:hypothetical protein
MPQEMEDQLFHWFINCSRLNLLHVGHERTPSTRKQAEEIECLLLRREKSASEDASLPPNVKIS